MKDANRILEYWYNLEFFSPYWPKLKKPIYITANKREMPWTNPDPKYNYNLYLGKVQTYEFIVKMLNSLGMDKENSIEKENTLSCVCAIKVSDDGHYLAGSFTVSTFIWAVAKIIKHKNLRAQLTLEEFKQFNDNMNDWLSSIKEPVNYNNIIGLLKTVLNALALSENDCKYSGLIDKVFAKQKKEDEQESITDNATDMLSSFYAKDLYMVKNDFEEKDRITRYIEALLVKTNKFEIDKDINCMKKWLSPELYPLGKWPSKYSPSLMQQLAINIAISEGSETNNIFSVNGPPGTGKTTLLKEIIASNVVDRAYLLSQYNRPNDAFCEKSFKSPPDQHTQKYYEIAPKLKKYGIIVASNNNAAVENISTELPSCSSIKDANTSLFMLNEVYFSQIASKLLEKSGLTDKCWGLISARLGRASNIGEFKQVLWFDQDITNLQKLYKQPAPNWNKAKELFLEKYNQVLSYRKKYHK